VGYTPEFHPSNPLLGSLPGKLIENKYTKYITKSKKIPPSTFVNEKRLCYCMQILKGIVFHKKHAPSRNLFKTIQAGFLSIYIYMYMYVGLFVEEITFFLKNKCNPFEVTFFKSLNSIL